MKDIEFNSSTFSNSSSDSCALSPQKLSYSSMNMKAPEGLNSSSDNHSDDFSLKTTNFIGSAPNYLMMMDDLGRLETKRVRSSYCWDRTGIRRPR